MNETPDTVLAPEDPPPFIVDEENGTSAFLFVADHAGRRMPRRLGQLGLPSAELDRHIAWDIGAGAVACLLGKALNAVVVRQTYSRLVIECARLNEIFKPYHDRIAQELDRRSAAGRAAVLISVHSFTPVFKAVTRPWHVGVLHNRDPSFAHGLLALLNREEGLIVGDNEPYSLSDESDYTIPVHGELRGLPHAEIEIRQDLITEETGQSKWAALLARLLPEVHARLKRASI